MSRLVKIAAFLVVAGIAIIAIILLIWYLLAGRLPKPEIPTPPPEKPKSQPASCPDVQLIAIPGTWESVSTDDPHNPTFQPLSLMLNITRPIEQRFPKERVDVYTIPYVAQFSNPIAIPPDGQVSYNLSRGEGTQRTLDVMAGMHNNCPLTNFVLSGFSQGAVIAGDVASMVGNGKGPVPADQLLGATLIADGRRADGQGVPIGPDPQGTGAEVTLAGLQVPGITMTGPRPGGFGELQSKVFKICTPGDSICDAPRDGLNPFNIPASIGKLLSSLGVPLHTMYNTAVVDEAGTSATQWTVNWAAGLIDGAPHPEHDK